MARKRLSRFSFGSDTFEAVRFDSTTSFFERLDTRRTVANTEDANDPGRGVSYQSDLIARTSASSLVPALMAAMAHRASILAINRSHTESPTVAEGRSDRIGTEHRWSMVGDKDNLHFLRLGGSIEMGDGRSTGMRRKDLQTNRRRSVTFSADGQASFAPATGMVTCVSAKVGGWVGGWVVWVGGWMSGG